MRSHTRNLLISSALVFLGFSNMAVGSETLTTTRAEESHLVRQQENPVCGNMPVTVTGDDLKAWGIRPSDSLATSFFKSLFGPFIQDAPKVLETVAAQKEKLAKEGVVEYTSNVGSAVGEAIIENPLDAIILGGALASGFTSEECKAILQLTAGIASGLKNSQALWAFAHSLGKDKERLQFVLYSAAALYALQSLTPVAGALTATVGTPFQINQFSNAPVSIAVSQDGTKLCLATRDANSPPNVIGTIFNMDTDVVTKNITVSTTPAEASVYPRVSATQNGFGFGWTSSSSSSSATNYRFYSNSGTASDAPLQGNQVATYGGLGQSTVAGSPTQANTGFGAWSGSDGSGDYILGCEITSSGPQTKEFIINNPPYNIGGDPCIIQQGDVVTAGWLDSPNFVTRSFFSNGTLGAAPVGLNQTAVSSARIRCTPLESNKVVFGFPAATGPAARITQNAVPSGSQFSLGSGQVGAEVSLSSCDGGTKFLSAFPGTGTKDVQLGYSDSNGNSLGQTSIPGSHATYTDVACKSQSTDCAVVWSNNSGTYGADVSLTVPPTPSPTHTPTPTVAPTPAPTPTSAASGLASSVAALTTSALLWYYGGN